MLAPEEMQLDGQRRRGNRDRFLAMAGLIIFDNDLDGPYWKVSNWVYRCFLDHVIASVQNDSELIDKITLSKYVQCLDLDTLAEEKPRLHSRAIDALNHTCNQIIDGKCTLMNGDREMSEGGQVRFRGGIVSLSQMLSAYADKAARTQADVQQE